MWWIYLVFKKKTFLSLNCFLYVYIYSNQWEGVYHYIYFSLFLKKGVKPTISKNNKHVDKQTINRNLSIILCHYHLSLLLLSSVNSCYYALHISHHDHNEDIKRHDTFPFTYIYNEINSIKFINYDKYVLISRQKKVNWRIWR